MIADCLVRTPTPQPLWTPLAALQKGGRGATLRVPPPPCSLQLQKRGRDAEQYLKDTVLHLHSPQVPVRDTAVRFLGESHPQWVPIPPAECCGVGAQRGPWGTTGEMVGFLGVIRATLGLLGQYGVH